MLGHVRGRIVAGVAAWLLGACAATGGSLLAVSLIGKGMATGFPSQPDADAVQAARTPASIAPGTPAAPVASTSSAVAPARPGPSRPASSSPHPHRTGLSTAPTSPAAPSGATTAPAPATTPPPVPAGTPDGTVLTSSAGEVVAACPAAGAYLLSWSPQQGYAVGSVHPGPAAVAQVTFISDTEDTVTMTITCQGGVPVASAHSQQHDE